MWDTGYYSKQMFEAPWEDPLLTDWVKQYNKNDPKISIGKIEKQSEYSVFYEDSEYIYEHYPESNHTTVAITNEAINEMKLFSLSKQKNLTKVKNMFLYVSYTAVHSPLEPEEKPFNSEHCRDISELNRKKFCGLLVGLDENVKLLTENVEKYLGKDTIIIFSSDNGGSPWFGGNNAPLRGTKGTPYEGGIRTPAFITDLSNGKYIPLPATGKELNNKNHYQRAFYGLFHITDWLPTITSLARIDDEKVMNHLNKIHGIDMNFALKLASQNGCTLNSNDRNFYYKTLVDTSYCNTSPRKSILVELYDHKDTLFNQTVESVIYGDYKFIRGNTRDFLYYNKNDNDNKYLNITLTSNFDLSLGESMCKDFLNKDSMENNADDIITVNFCNELIFNSNHIQFKENKNQNYLSYVMKFLYNTCNFGENFFGSTQFDTFKITLVHVFFHNYLQKYYNIFDNIFSNLIPSFKERKQNLNIINHSQEYKHLPLQLYNLALDPKETINLAYEPWSQTFIKEIDSMLTNYKATKPPVKPVHMQHENNKWRKTFSKGRCPQMENPYLSYPKNSKEYCFYTHPWLNNNQSLESFSKLYSANDYIKMKMNYSLYKTSLFFIFAILIYVLIIITSRYVSKVYKDEKNPNEYLPSVYRRNRKTYNINAETKQQEEFEHSYDKSISASFDQSEGTKFNSSKPLKRLGKKK